MTANSFFLFLSLSIYLLLAPAATEAATAAATAAAAGGAHVKDRKDEELPGKEIFWL